MKNEFVNKEALAPINPRLMAFNCVFCFERYVFMAVIMSVR